jgi:hypothetical protein
MYGLALDANYSILCFCQHICRAHTVLNKLFEVVASFFSIRQTSVECLCMSPAIFDAFACKLCMELRFLNAVVLFPCP